MNISHRQPSGSSLDVCTLRRRNAELHALCNPLPGSQPYDNFRPINVSSRYEGRTLLHCVCAMHPHVGEVQWLQWFEAGLILKDGSFARPNQIVRGGQQYWHVFLETVEPDVDAKIEVLWEDESMVAVHKPAPLPVHPCGRFNFNTMTSLLDRVYGPGELRLVHRLDANTTGVMLLAKSASVATNLRLQFEKNEVKKRYVVRCNGSPQENEFRCDKPISRNRSIAGTRDIHLEGDPARTDFVVRHRFDDGTSLVDAFPATGRTNQIRIHLWSLGLPVMGDVSYLPNDGRSASQTLSVGDPPMCLHAAELSFVHPVTKRSSCIQSSAPPWSVVATITSQSRMLQMGCQTD